MTTCFTRGCNGLLWREPGARTRECFTCGASWPLNQQCERVVMDTPAMRITAITLSKEDQERLCTGGGRLPAYGEPAHDESCLRGLEWTLASVLIGASMGWLIAGWLQ